MASRSNPYPMGVSDPLPAGYIIWFGSLEFRATGNGYLMELLSSRRNPDIARSTRTRQKQNVLVLQTIRSLIQKENTKGANQTLHCKAVT